MTIGRHYSPNKPPQNEYVESFNGQMRDEMLNKTRFYGLSDARATIGVWVADYVSTRPHSS